MERGKGSDHVPEELVQVLADDPVAQAFFDSLADSYKRRYCQWVARPRDGATRQSRAEWSLGLLQSGQKSLKIDSYMGDVGIIKRIDDDPAMRAVLIALCTGKTHREVSQYAVLLAEHVLRITGTPMDEGLQACIDINRRWQGSDAHFQEARDVAGVLFARARAERDTVQAKLLRVMGQAAATPHVKRHALIASDYAVTMINAMHPGNMEAVREERRAQIAMMESV